jgi:hypothetical protein
MNHIYSSVYIYKKHCKPAGIHNYSANNLPVYYIDSALLVSFQAVIRWTQIYKSDEIFVHS